MILGRFSFPSDTAANFTLHNPVLKVAELAVELDTDKFKIGDGVTSWNMLPYGGLQGETGNGIVNIARIVGDGSAGTTDTYAINYTNGSSTTFNVYNGSNGRSVISVTRTTGTGSPGTTDIYTITYSDSTISTFSVYNGMDGKGDPAANAPQPIGSSSLTGTVTTRYALEDHTHEGVSSISVNGGAAQKGAVGISIPNPYTDEQAQDTVAAMLTGATHNGVSVAYNDGANTLAITNNDKGSSAVSTHEGLADPHPQYTTVTEAAAAAPVQSVNGQTGNVIVSAASVQSAVLTATQANTTVTEATLTGHTFTIPPGKSAVITGNLIFTGAATSTGAFYGVLVTQGAGANDNAVGSWSAYVDISSAATATGLSDGDAFNLAGGASTPAGSGVLGTATVAGNNSARLSCLVKNNSTNADTTVQIRFRSEVANSAVTAQIGTMAVCVVS